MIGYIQSGVCPIKNQNQKTESQIARENFVKARLYGFVSLGFVFVGFIIFFIFYDYFIGGDVSNFFKKPLLFAVVFLPFLPAYIFALLSIKKRNTVLKILYGDKNTPAKGDGHG
ncbi:MAG: hypothetical protein IT559_04955 [Alphaproteobacteria bacterium]|nr:hypothetical protein [Alphaproteobacteria bacterium]